MEARLTRIGPWNAAEQDGILFCGLKSTRGGANRGHGPAVFP